MNTPMLDPATVAKMKKETQLVLATGGFVALIPYLGMIMILLVIPIVICLGIWGNRIFKSGHRKQGAVVLIATFLFVPYVFFATSLSLTWGRKLYGPSNTSETAQVPTAVPDDAAAIRMEATKNYWESYFAFLDKKNADEANLKASTQGKYSESEYLAKLAGIQQVNSDQLRNLPTLHVDPDSVNLILRFADYNAKGAVWLRDQSQYIQAMKDLEKDSHSGGAMFEAFLRGIAGDLLGKSNEVKSAYESLNRVGQVLNERKAALENEGETLKSALAQHGALLTQRYSAKH